MIKYFVFDTNTLISASLLIDSVNRKAIRKAILLGEISFSSESINEFKEVIFRKKFDRYFISDEERLELFNEIENSITQFFPSEAINACRDPKDNKFLELAIAASASCIITGDKDLLILNPFRNIPILNAFDFLNNYQTTP
ncbi:MAG: putative toxin-antitoxin system toxin component, PIN family [Bacteroidetes bacterium]|nr:putative toxin-antitoxin system toxin component, PIN family [Bacteroidota bacterium]